jgi:hypothetical protein
VTDCHDKTGKGIAMTYAEALKLAKAERKKDFDATMERQLRTCNMHIEERETLGALFHEYVSGIGQPADTYLSGVSYGIDTQVGKLVVHYSASVGAIFGRFERAEEAARVLGHMEVNCHSGKWNTHTSKGDDPAHVFQNWKRQLGRILP